MRFHGLLLMNCLGAVRRILKIQLGTKPITGRDMEELRSILVDLQFQLNSLINRIPLAQHPNSVRSDLNSASSASTTSWSVPPGPSGGQLPGDGPGGCAEQYHTPVLIAFHKWARILLSLFVDKAFCVAYQPFLKNAKSRIWPTARQSALRHCHGFMEKFIALATDPDFQPFQWSWPGNHQPMHATMIMLIDLYERPSSPQALRSRAFIDKIFSISGPDGGVVGGEDGVTTARPLKDGGREAWDMMRRLREKAWQKAGLNPQQLWTEQAQIRAGVAHETKRAQPPHTRRQGETPAPVTRPNNDSQIADFNKRFFEMTRAHVLPNPVVSSLRQGSQVVPPPRRSPVMSQSSPTSSSIRPPSQSSYMPTNITSPSSVFMSSPPLDSQSLDATLTLANLATGAAISSPPPNSQSLLPQRHQQQLQQQQQQVQLQHKQSNGQSYQNYTMLSGTPSSASFSPLNSPQAASTTSPSAGAASAPTPPSMVDPNVNFDWDQWDAVFGQQIPMADELIEIDPVVGELGLGSTDIGIDLSNHTMGNSSLVNGNEYTIDTTPAAGDVWRDFDQWQY